MTLACVRLTERTSTDTWVLELQRLGDDWLGCWELNWGSLQKRQIRLATEPSSHLSPPLVCWEGGVRKRSSARCGSSWETFRPSSWEAEAGRALECEVCLVYTEFRTARAKEHCFKKVLQFNTEWKLIITKGPQFKLGWQWFKTSKANLFFHIRQSYEEVQKMYHSKKKTKR